MTTSSKPIDIVLVRGKSGLGFNIRGGIDNPHVPDDPGIFVVQIREKGAASQDGRLQEGDKIIAINGTNVERVAHNSAVQLFRLAGDTVRLSVQQKVLTAIKAQQNKDKMQMNGDVGDRVVPLEKMMPSEEEEGGGWSPVSLVLTTSTLALALFFGYRYLQKHQR